ncbi:peptidoglycan-binding domain-containing protein [Methyloceanibacter sp. wino2]|uniref:peptidoglycan-binding domain-containing protein n=1 Tax=Methyloceanibacter sp. wino2 TaxID=2170729 RepID=UPI000D3E878D|nr:peptidoglycan-binding domain-containing protein [Methyloceanibacter sp. wino2]
MGVVTARLLFLAFLGMTATIIYNALYLQEHAPHGMADARSAGSGTTRVIGVEPPSPNVSADSSASTYEKTPDSGGGVAPVVTDLPAQPPGDGESLLVVRAIQRELSLRGYDVGTVDGQLSDKTRKAISAFQMREGLAITGLPSDDVLRQILLGDTIANSDATGSVPPADSIAAQSADDSTVLRVQQVLAELGYAPGIIDGQWGENTADAVSAFQQDRNMAVTGSITPELLAELQRVTGRDLTRTAASNR